MLALARRMGRSALTGMLCMVLVCATLLAMALTIALLLYGESRMAMASAGGAAFLLVAATLVAWMLRRSPATTGRPTETTSPRLDVQSTSAEVADVVRRYPAASMAVGVCAGLVLVRRPDLLNRGLDFAQTYLAGAREDGRGSGS